MSNCQTKQLTWLFVLAVGILASTYPCYADAPGFVGDPALLRKVAEAHRANVQRIITWRASVSTNVSIVQNDDVKNIDRSESFLHDAVRKQSLWRSKIQNAQALPGTWSISNSLYHGDRFYQLEGSPEPAVQQMLSIDPRAPKDLNGVANAHPMVAFRQVGEDYSKSLDFQAEIVEQGRPTMPCVVERVGEVVRVTYRFTATEGIKVMEFDLAQGGNLVRTTYADANLRTNRVTQYVLVDGVYLPSMFSDVNSMGPMDSARTITHTSQWENHVLNQPIDDAEFSLQALGLRKGDRVHDRVNKTNYSYGEPAEAK